MNHLLHNKLLSSLSAEVSRELLSQMTHEALPFRSSLYSPGQRPTSAIFLTSGLASVVATSAEGDHAEVAMIGQEGIVGGEHLLGPGSALAECFMQTDGTGWRISFAHLKALFDHSAELRESILEFVQCYNFNVTQVASCNRSHDAELRIARWLVMAQERMQTGEFQLTHEIIAMLVGTGRPTVSTVTASLQERRIIRNVRGRLLIAKSDELQSLACSCTEPMLARVAGLYRHTRDALL